MERNCLEQYCHEVGRRLICRKNTRKNILKGLFEEIAGNSELEWKSLQEIEKTVGSINDTAAMIQEGISETEVTAVKRIRNLMILSITGAVILSMVMGGIIYTRYLNNKNLLHVETIIIYEDGEDAWAKEGLENIHWEGEE